MIRADICVLGAGVVGTSIALQLARRGVSVVLADRKAPGEETSYGNAGIIEGNTLFPHTFPRSLSTLAHIAFKRAPGTNYHLSFLPRVLPWLCDFYRFSAPDLLPETARAMRPLFANAVAEHRLLMEEAGADHYLRDTGWLKLYRTTKGFRSTERERGIADDYGVAYNVLTAAEACRLEPDLGPAFEMAIHWTGASSVSNPMAVTKAYAARLQALGGRFVPADVRRLVKQSGGWHIETCAEPVDAGEVVIALGPWTPDILKPLALEFPLAVKRGYHLHFDTGRAQLSRPVVDTENGYCMAPMEQGLRITTGAEFAARDAKPSPVQLDRVMPHAKSLFPLGAQKEPRPWMGSRPCFADSRPVIGPAKGNPGLWLAFGHGHSGLTLAAATGRLVAEMLLGATTFCDPAPYAAERFA